MSDDKAVRKEFEAVAEDILDSAYDMLISHGQRKRAIIAKLQTSRSAAIQECADKMRAMNHPAYADMILLALKER